MVEFSLLGEKQDDTLRRKKAYFDEYPKKTRKQTIVASFFQHLTVFVSLFGIYGYYLGNYCHQCLWKNDTKIHIYTISF